MSDILPRALKSSKEGQPAVVPGMRAEIKELYREDEIQAWDDWCPDDVDVPIEESSEIKGYALIVRRQKCQASLVVHSIVIQSPHLREVLGKVFEGYKGISTKLKDLTFTRPFHEFYYRWDRFQEEVRALHEEDGGSRLSHINLLQDVIRKEIQPHIEKKEDLLTHGLITFDYLWALFEPGLEIYTNTDGQDRLYRLVSSKYIKLMGGVLFEMTGRYIDCDGTSFGYVSTQLSLGSFDGIMGVSELNIIPSYLHHDVDRLRGEMRKRGAIFEKLNGYHYRSYNGFVILSHGYHGGSNKQQVCDLFWWNWDQYCNAMVRLLTNLTYNCPGRRSHYHRFGDVFHIQRR